MEFLEGTRNNVHIYFTAYNWLHRQVNEEKALNFEYGAYWVRAV